MIKPNDDFQKKLFSIAIPVAIQSFISTSLNLVDSVMIGFLKETSLAAVGIANKYYYLFILIIYGLCSAFAIYISQFWGKKDSDNIRKVLSILLISVCIVSIVFTIIAQLFPGEIISIFLKESVVINLGSDYLKIVSISYIITSISMSYSTSFRSIGKAKVMMYFSVIALLCNTSLNYILIFGKLGLPSMGVKGAAIATLISRGIELLLILAFTYSSRSILIIHFDDIKTIKFTFVKKIYKRALPVIINEGMWSLGTIIYCIAYGAMGAGAIAVIQICDVLQNFFMIIGKGLATSASVMIGSLVGKGRYSKVNEYTTKFLRHGFISGIFMGIILIISAPIFIRYYNISEPLKIEGVKTLQVIGFFLAIKIINVIMISGIFRGGGETLFSSILDISTVWFLGIPLAFFSVHVLNFPIYLVVALVSLEEVLKMLIAYKKLRSKNWVKNLVNEIDKMG